MKIQIVQPTFFNSISRTFLISLLTLILIQSRVSGFYNQTKNYTFLNSINYIVDDTDPNDLQLIVQLRILNFDVSTWTLTDGSQGIFMAFGYGSQNFNDTDITMCIYQYRNLNSDQFVCSDSFSLYPNISGPPSVGQLLYVTNETQNIQEVKTLQSNFYKENKYSYGNFGLQFKRPFNTKEAKDYVLYQEMIKYVFGYGDLRNKLPEYSYIRSYWGTLDLIIKNDSIKDTTNSILTRCHLIILIIAIALLINI
ncbi:UNKNOWN [Stylonychia lemnae]|uniref:DOMON domain-containing protein n=1 Tax=Stylonychia lemnae TaxID=5949 RepID=A0A078AY25_STYLE|nr:UNKNOWN [Stylonychia lemnae]|eukprot:CDW87330.1 UNKNOWN [Stylonychia lemnae]